MDDKNAWLSLLYITVFAVVFLILYIFFFPIAIVFTIAFFVLWYLFHEPNETN